MAWHGILEHDDVVERFGRALARGRLATSFLFVGPEGIGKRRFALKLAQALLCPVHPEAAMDPCESCPACTQVQALTHPDLDFICKPADKSFLPLEMLIGDKEHRGREGLCHRIAMKPLMGGRKVAMIDDADYLNPEGANCLLKTLEEPPPRSVLILIGTSPAKQLPTIRSRCQVIRFRPLRQEAVAEILLAHGLAQDSNDARRLAAQSGGSVQRAIQWADQELWGCRELLRNRLATPLLQSADLARQLLAFLEPSGTDAQARRDRLRHVVGLAAEFYRQLVRRLCGASGAESATPDPLLDQAARQWPHDVDTAVECLERCLEAAEQVDRNVHPTTLVESWLDELARITTPGQDVFHPPNGASRRPASGRTPWHKGLRP